MKRRIVILGATGSIGKSARRVLEAHPEEFDVLGVAAGSRVEELVETANALHAKRLVLSDPAKQEALSRAAAPGTVCETGPAALTRLAELPEADIVLCAIVGTGGIAPVLAALEQGKKVALASKEVLVCAGELVQAAAKRGGGQLIPVDSEHSAIYQCLECRAENTVKKLILTASGGAFRDSSIEEMRRADARAALAHPVWSMGPKVTIDSASMMNKALELIEAHHLFSVPAEKLDVLVHPQSIVHSLVEFTDGAMLALLSRPDMALPIQYALTHPARPAGTIAALDLAEAGRLDFRRVDQEKYPSLDFAYAAIRQGGTAGAVLNAANEIAVAEFCAGNIAFPAIWSIIEMVMAKTRFVPQENLAAVMDADTAARSAAKDAARRFHK